MGSVFSCCPCAEGIAKEAQSSSSAQACSVAGYGDYDGAPQAPAIVITSAPAPAPEPPKEPEKPKRPAPTCPITLDILQGNWVNSMGAKITVEDTKVTLNGMVMKMHPVMLNDDGTIASVGKIWQLNGWLEDEEIEFKECPSREVMQFARSVVWSRATAERMEEWNTHMSRLGYSGSAADPLKRGVEGCMAGSMDAKARENKTTGEEDQKDLETLNRLLSEWRVPGIRRIPPRLVIPDFSNRGHTGLSVEHVHYLAASFKEKGFIKRVGSTGHDIPVLIEDSPQSEMGMKAVANWREKLKDEDGFPPKEHYERLFQGNVMYTSLGNGHFNQALNLFLNECKSIYKDEQYTIDDDVDLREAITDGPSALILKNSIPLSDRMTISKLLNSKREFKWDVNPDGTLNVLNAEEDMKQCKQFEALSKVLDAVELNCLVRAELKVSDSSRVGQ